MSLAHRISALAALALVTGGLPACTADDGTASTPPASSSSVPATEPTKAPEGDDLAQFEGEWKLSPIMGEGEGHGFTVVKIDAAGIAVVEPGAMSGDGSDGRVLANGDGTYTLTLTGRDAAKESNSYTFTPRGDGSFEGVHTGSGSDFELLPN